MLEDGGPERAATQWYHDHRLDRTARNVWRGLAGMWILDDEVDAALPLPRDQRDLPLILADRSFDSKNQLTDPFSVRRNPPDDGTTGSRVLVNGALLPTHRVSPLRHRLRILNSSLFRSYSIAFSRDVEVVQIAADAGLIPAPLRRNRVLIGPGERVELVVDFASARGRMVEMVSVARGSKHRAIGSRSWRGTLMRFEVDPRRAIERTRVPSLLRPLPDWLEDAPQTPSHSWRISVGGGFRPRWEINGRAYDPAYADVKVKLGSTVCWELVNDTATAHLFHLHHTDWYVLSRNGRPPPPWERCLKETFFLDPGERLLLAGRFSDHTGMFVVHCHMLDHEDHGLMSQFEVVG